MWRLKGNGITRKKKKRGDGIIHPPFSMVSHSVQGVRH